MAETETTIADDLSDLVARGRLALAARRVASGRAAEARAVETAAVIDAAEGELPVLAGLLDDATPEQWPAWKRRLVVRSRGCGPVYIAYARLVGGRWERIMWDGPDGERYGYAVPGWDRVARAWGEAADRWEFANEVGLALAIAEGTGREQARVLAAASRADRRGRCKAVAAGRSVGAIMPR